MHIYETENLICKMCRQTKVIFLYTCQKVYYSALRETMIFLAIFQTYTKNQFFRNCPEVSRSVA